MDILDGMGVSKLSAKVFLTTPLNTDSHIQKRVVTAALTILSVK